MYESSIRLESPYLEETLHTAVDTPAELEMVTLNVGDGHPAAKMPHADAGWAMQANYAIPSLYGAIAAVSDQQFNHE